MSRPAAEGCGVVVWITGLPCAGKTTVGRALWARLRAQLPNSVFLDGDALRDVLGGAFGHSPDERRRVAEHNCRLARLLAEQGLHTVVATISMFDAVRAWNRAHLARYLEVYLRVPERVRRARDDRGLYSVSRHVVGLDLPFEEPRSADLVIDDSGDLNVAAIVERIWTRLHSRHAP